MHRIDTPTAAPGGLFTGGNPGSGVSPTHLSPEHMNALQEEIAYVIEQAGTTLSKPSNTQLLAAILAHIGTQAGGDKNAVINGAFDVWQRGTSFAGIGHAGAWTADRWQAFGDTPSGSGAATVTRELFVVGQTDVPDDPIYFLRHQQTANATAGQPTVQTKVEDVRRYSGTRMLSFWGKASGALTVGSEVHQNFGGGGSSEVLAGSASHSFTTSWQKFTQPVTMPSISGKTIGTKPHLRLAFRGPTGATYSIDIANVQFEKGAGASPFERRPLQREVGLCQRYFQKSYDLGVAPGTATFAGCAAGHDPTSPGVQVLQQRLGVPMLDVPTVVWYSPNDGASANIWDETNTTNRAVTAQTGVGQQSTGWPTISPTVANAGWQAQWTAQAEL